jgi:hypothetical protein
MRLSQSGSRRPAGSAGYLERECRTDGAGADDVMAAAVTDAGQCIERGNKSQRRTWPTTIPADERCGQSTDAALDRKAASVARSARIADPRIEGAVQQIDQHVDRDKNQRQPQDGRLRHRVMPRIASPAS